MDKCPKCGGNNGYEGKLIVSFDMSGAWGKEWETTTQKTTYRSKNVKCVDCGKRVAIEQASNE